MRNFHTLSLDKRNNGTFEVIYSLNGKQISGFISSKSKKAYEYLKTFINQRNTKNIKNLEVTIYGEDIDRHELIDDNFKNHKIQPEI